MKQRFRRLLAVIFTIAMVLGMVPFSSKRVEAYTPVVYNTVFTTRSMQDENNCVKRNVDKFVGSSLGGGVASYTDQRLINNRDEFVDQWNKMPSRQFVVVIDSHGDPFDLCAVISSSEVRKKLQHKTISYLVLLGCNCGNYDYRASNIARVFADTFQTTVIASDGTVWARIAEKASNKRNKKVDNEPDEYEYSSKASPSWNGRSYNYGWLAYIPRNSSNNYQSKVYRLLDCSINNPYKTLYQILMNYTSGSKSLMK